MGAESVCWPTRPSKSWWAWRGQIVQRDYEDFLFRIVPAAGFDSALVEAHVVDELRLRLGVSPQVKFEYLATIPRGPSGKLQAVQVEF